MASLWPAHPSHPKMQLHLSCAFWQDSSVESGEHSPAVGFGGHRESGCHTTSDICDLLCTELGLFPSKASGSPSSAPGSPSSAPVPPPVPVSSSSLCPDSSVSVSALQICSF